MTTADILRDSLELLSDPARWTKNASARDAGGYSVNPWAESAVCWCATGAPYKVAGPSEQHSALAALRLLTRALHMQVVGYDEPQRKHAEIIGPGAVPPYNDHPDRTHAEVIALYRRALALAELVERALALAEAAR